jgi:predicted RNA-binding protein associated with RNAse of E/G family
VPEPRYAPGDTVTIHYRRPPDRLEVFEQAVVDDDGECVVTYLPSAQIAKPMQIGGRVVLEPGAPIIWFTYRGDVWHDVGRFHLADGTFSGVYANVLTPVRMDGAGWDTTDLFLDIWINADGEIEVLDRDEFRAAHAAGWIDFGTAMLAGKAMHDLLDGAQDGSWPSIHVREWTLERVRGVLEGASGSG